MWEAQIQQWAGWWDFYFPLVKAFLQGIAKTREGGGSSAEVRSLRCRVGGRIGSSATHSSNEPQTQWLTWPGLGLLGSDHSQGPANSPDVHSPRGKGLLPADWGKGAGQRLHLGRPQLPAAQQLWAAVMAVTVPFQGSDPRCPGGKLSTLPEKLWALNPPAQKQNTVHRLIVWSV